MTDVTLVSSDGLQLQAHKTVLCSSSSFFREILIVNPHPGVLLYMRGKTLLRTVRELGYEGLLETIGNRGLYVI